MSTHAIQRLAERAPGHDPRELLTIITHALAQGSLPFVVETVSRQKVFRFDLTGGGCIFPVVATDGAIVTVLADGMDCETATGRMVLRAAPITSGLHRLEAEAYHRDPAPRPSLSSTLAKLMLAQSPLHAWTASPTLNPDWEPVEKKTFDIGRAAHRAILGAGSDFCAIPDELLSANGAVSTKAAKEFVAEARDAGLTPLKTDEVALIEQMRAKMAEKLAGLEIVLDPDRSETVALAELDGIWCRAMVDNAPADPRLPLYDFKTTTDASPEAAVRAVMNYGYDVQAAHYLDTWKAATGEDRSFRFIFQEKTAPFEVAVVELDAEALVMAQKKIARARADWRDCLETGHWPGYPLGVHVVSLPAFFHERWLERESADAETRRRTSPEALDRARRWQSPEPYLQAGE